MKHRGLKFLSLLLTLVMMLGLTPNLTAWAAFNWVDGSDTIYYEGDSIPTGGKSFAISTVSGAEAPDSFYRIVGESPVVASASEGAIEIQGSYNGNNVSYKVTAANETRKPIGVKIHKTCEYQNNYTMVIFSLVYGFKVTYQPGNRASLKDGTQFSEGSTKRVVNGNIVHTVTADNAITYKVESFDSYFIAPEGQVFDKWIDSAGNPHKNEETIPLTGDLTLTAQWKEKSSDGGSGSGVADLVFNVPGVDNSWEYVGGGVPQRAYRVSLAPMQGGSAALGLTTGESGTALNVYPTSTVCVFPNAEPGYTLDKIVWSLIDGSASYDITEAKNFVMPAMDVVVNVTFRPVG